MALNHVPVLGTVFVGLLLGAALLRKSEKLKRVSLVGFVALAVVSIPIKFTGDFASEKLAGDKWLLTNNPPIRPPPVCFCSGSRPVLGCGRGGVDARCGR